MSNKLIYTNNNIASLSPSTSSNGFTNSNKIKEEMTADQIAEIISDHLIHVIREQFEKSKADFRANADQ